MSQQIDINVFETIENVEVVTTEEVTTVNVNIIQSTGAVSSVNGQTGSVVIDADDIDDTTTIHKFVSASERNAITHSNRSVLDATTASFTTTLKSTYDTNVTSTATHIADKSNPHSVTATQVDALQRNGSNANSDVDLGAYAINAKSVKVNGTAGSGNVTLKHQSANATAGGQETALFAGSDGELYYKNDGNALAQVASRAWVGLQGYITNVITALGYTPANKAGDTFTGAISATNLSGTNTGDETATTIRTKVGNASASNTGVLSSTDWSTFNGKQNALGYTPEDTANKSTSTTDSASTTKYPVWSAIVSYFSSSQIRSILGVSTLSGSNTGDETKATIISKLGYTPRGILIKDPALSSNLTGTTSETIVSTYTIAGGAVATSDIADLAIKAIKSGTAGNFTLKIYVNTAANLTGASLIIQPTISATNLYTKIIRSLTFRGGNLVVYASGLGGNTDIANATSAQTSVSLNTSNTWYLIITLTNANSGDTTNISEVSMIN